MGKGISFNWHSSKLRMMLCWFMPERRKSGSGSAAMLGFLVLIGGFEAPASLAADVTISARYRGEASGRFEDITPPIALCSQWPSFCALSQTVEVPLTYTKQTVKLAPNIRDRFYMKVPRQRTFEVEHQVTGERYQLIFEIIALSLRASGRANQGNGAGGRPQGGCGQAGVGFENGIDRFLLWSVNTPLSPTACYSDSEYDHIDPGHVWSTDISEMGIGYRLSMPSALKMKQGLYRGRQTFSVGAAGEFDLGNAVTNLNSSTLTVNFELDVQHSFFLAFAPGSEHAQLEPPGGWQQWSNGGRSPERLYHDLSFRLWSSGPFKVYKLCQYDQAGRCAIRNPASHQVPITVALSLPTGIEHGGGQVSRLSIPTGRASALAFEQMTPTLNRPGQLHFQVEQDDVRGMLSHAGSSYEGQVTVVFDADL